MSGPASHTAELVAPRALPSIAEREKRRVALTSVLAAVALTGAKLIVGLVTGSLGLISEAAHSGLDFVAAAVTYLAVRVSDKPADAEHRYGHGKVENLSALVETLLLLITCVWIINEAVARLLYKKVEVQATVWSFAVILASIVIDVSRSRALMYYARRHRSQALEADALHFGTDVWSSAVVLVGLLLVKMGEHLGLPGVFQRADAVAALGVAAIVVLVSVRLGRRTIDALLDRAPSGVAKALEGAVAEVPGVLSCTRLRVRESGHRTFVDLILTVAPHVPVEASHAVCDAVEKRICELLPEADVLIHIDPDASTAPADGLPELSERRRSP